MGLRMVGVVVVVVEARKQGTGVRCRKTVENEE
jgi:hypothetical protein